MKIDIRDIFKVTYLQQKVSEDKFEEFQLFFEKFKKSIKDDETEEYNKNLITTFLNDTFYKENYQINTSGRVDLAIYNEEIPEVLIEVKSPTNKNEMITIDNLNKKGFQEIILYYLREKFDKKNYNIRNIVITNTKEWFVIDASEINRISNDKKIEKLYKEFEIGKTSAIKKTEEFYQFLETYFKEKPELLNIPFVHFDIEKIDEVELKYIYKLLSPQHLLKTFKVEDLNTLNKEFYYELLYILGLEEVKSGNVKVIKRAKKREFGSLIENTILKLQTEHKITDEEKLFEISFNLNITWLNRILFLKLFEARLLKLHKGKYPKFLSFELCDEFDKLNTIFFEVLSIKQNNRKAIMIKHFEKLPYLNSSLFETTQMERNYLRISNLKNNLPLKKYSNSVLKNEKKVLNSLEYLLKFLGAYDFGSDEKAEFRDTHTIINSSVLGLIFEKLNGYKDGSFFTPAFITIYMTKEVIYKTIIEKFNKEFDINIENFEELKNYCSANFYKTEFKKQATKLLDDITIIDPAVGSGHFLVSALNELIVLKNELNLFLPQYQITNENDEIYVRDREEFKIIDISQELFHQKLHIIENQLFGVDINSNSVKITQLRLWIELLKNSYYEKDELVTLPNIDINIKVGNSLVNQFDTKIKIQNEIIIQKIQQYKEKVKKYKDITNKIDKSIILDEIKELKIELQNYFLQNEKDYKTLDKLLAIFRTKFNFEDIAKLPDELILMAIRSKSLAVKSLFEEEENKDKMLKNILELHQKIKDTAELYKNSFEWRFEFPEVLDNNGDFVGFDIVVANPPYISVRDISVSDKKVYNRVYGFSDDLYNYFFIKGFQLLKKDGVLGYITSNTFITINSKTNLRELLQSKKLLKFIPIDNPFDEANVEPAIVLIQDKEEVSEFEYIDLRGKKFKPAKYSEKVDVEIYKNSPHKVFFTPTPLNMEIYETFIPKVKNLMLDYWEKISTSTNIEKNRKFLEEYRNSLKEKEITLLGLVTDGGQGLATANNGKYIGVKAGTKEAERIKQTRVKKIKEFNKEFDTDYDITKLTEKQIRKLFDELKEKYGRDVFGQGYIYRIISKSEMVDVESLTDDEKKNGIKGVKNFVPYDKGDKDGNRWYYETPFYISWSEKNVKFLKSDKKARFQGYNFYFKEGFSWSDIHTILIKSRLKSKGVYDVKSMSLHSLTDKVSDKYFITILNSSFMSNYIYSFVNHTQTFQINDARQLPIIIPTQKELKEFEEIFDKAKEIKVKQFSNEILKAEAKKELAKIQKIVDKKVNKLYGIKEVK